MSSSYIKIRRTFDSAEHGEQQEEVDCPLCGASDEELVLIGRDLLFAKPGSYRLVKCRVCELEYVNPRPTPAALGPHYHEDYFGYAVHEKEPPLIAPMLRAFARGISNRRIAYLEKVVGRLTPELAVLDVGCGVNRLLQRMQEVRGVEGLGVDFKPEIVEYVKDTLGMPIVEGTLHTAAFEDGRFDVVLMMEYLEHESDPKAILAEARRVTKTGGHVALEIPHIDSLPGRLFRSVWWNLDLPRHLIFPTESSLRRMLDDVGYELISVKKFTFPFYVGMSIVQALGQRHWIKNRTWFPIVSSIIGAPFIPLQWLLPEFMFAVARAK